MAVIRDIGFEFGADTLGGLPLRSEGGGFRSPGVHVSQVIGDIYNRFIAPGERESFDHLPPDEQNKMRRYRELGFTWERIWEFFFRQHMISMLPEDDIVTQEELFHDGIYLTPDGVYIPDWTLLEFKCSWKSSRRTEIEAIEGEMWEWVTQMKCYCRAIDTTKALLFVFHVNGDYRPSVPMTRGLEFTFTEEELDDTWTMIKNHAHKMDTGA